MNPGFHPSFAPNMNTFMNPQPFAAPFNKGGPQNSNLLTLYIGDLEEQISEEFLYPYFSKFGPIYSLKIMRDRYLRKSRGFGFITYYNPKDVETARNVANHDIILSRPIRVTNYRSPKDTPANANVFLKDLDKLITIQEVDKALGKYGKIFSSKISTDENGVSRGYGYVQFETEKEAEECLTHAGQIFVSTFGDENKEKPINLPINVERYLPKSGRPNNAVQNNLYVKNLPKIPEGKTKEQHLKDLEKELKDKFSQGGKRPIGSFMLNNDNNGRFFSFICFENTLDAEAALNEYNNKEVVFECAPSDEPLYVNWAEKKAIRIKNLKERKFSRSNETNLYTKGLKKTVQKEELEKTFSQFGKITSCIVNDPTDTRIETRQGFVNFESKDDAKNAFIQAKDHPEIRALYVNDSVYINWHLKKEHNKKVKELKFYKPNMPPFPMGIGMDMGPFMMPFMPPHFAQFRPEYGGMGYQGRPGRGQFEMGGPQNPRVGGFQGNPHRPYPRQGGPGMPPGQRPKGQYNRPQGKYQTQAGKPMKQNMGGPMGSVAGGMGSPGNMEIPKNNNVPVQIPQVNPTNLKENLNEFLKLDKNKQRETLGNMLFPKIKKYADDELAPKITGMLIDFTVFEVQDIVEFLENEESLKEKIQEAKELIESQSG